MMEFKALHVPTLTEEVAGDLELLLNDLPGVEQFKITLETQELYIMFDDSHIEFQTLAQAMSKVGCSLRNINAAVLL